MNRKKNKNKVLIVVTIAMLNVIFISACSLVGKTNKNLQQDRQQKDKNKIVEHASDKGKVLNIYCWNTEFQMRMKSFYEGYSEDDGGDKTNFQETGKITNELGKYTVNWIITPTDDDAYQNKLDDALKENEEENADNRLDLFLVDSDTAQKYANSEYSLDVYELGLSKKDTKNMYSYTKQVCTSQTGALKGVSWQATPGVFAYRRSIAKNVLGTDNPEKVQDQLRNWEMFDKVAQKAKEKGYYMLSGFDDAYIPFTSNVTQNWLSDDNVIQIDNALWQWVNQTKKYTDNGYNQKTSLWDEQWMKGQGVKGKVFGYFCSTLGINYTLMQNSLEHPDEKAEVGNGCYGDWAVCEGPAPFYWGGSWLCAAAGTDNTSLIVDIMKKLACESETAIKISRDIQEYTNNQEAMEAIAASNYRSDFLGGQNPMSVFDESAKKINLQHIGADDKIISEIFLNAMKDYFNGRISKKAATKEFYQAVTEQYPDVSIP